MRENIRTFLEKHEWLRKIFIILIIAPHVVFWGGIFSGVIKPLYPPTAGTLFDWIFWSTLLSSTLLFVFTLLSKKALFFFFLESIYLCFFFIILIVMILFGSSIERARLEANGKIYTVASNMDDKAVDHYYLYEYENIFSFTEIDCHYAASTSQIIEILVLDKTVLAFFHGNLGCMYGENPFSKTWLDSAFFDTSLFNLHYRVGRNGKIIYELYKCNLDNTECVREPFYYETISLEEAELYSANWYRTTDYFYLYIGDELIYRYDKNPTCRIDGCILQ